MLNNSSPDTILAVNATLENCELKNAMNLAKEEKDESSKLLSMHKNHPNKTLRLIVIPFDINTYT